MTILIRTFAAAKTKNRAERARLNRDALTSEYHPSHPVLVREPVDTPQKYIDHTFRHRWEAQAWIDRQSITVKQPRIIIEVRKGLVEEVYSDTPVEVHLLDHDIKSELTGRQLRRFRSLEKAIKILKRQPFL